MLGHDPRSARSGAADARDAADARGGDTRSTGAGARGNRKARETERTRALTLAATDPANPYGAALPWPQGEGHRPGRKAGALVVMVDGELVLYVERGGKTVLAFADSEEVLIEAADSLAATVVSGRVDKLTIEKINGEFSVGTLVGRLLEIAGFSNTPRGLRLRSA